MASQLKVTTRRGIIRSQRLEGSIVSANGRQLVKTGEGYANRADVEDTLFDVALGEYARAAARFRCGQVLPPAVWQALVAHEAAVIGVRRAIAEAGK